MQQESVPISGSPVDRRALSSLSKNIKHSLAIDYYLILSRDIAHALVPTEPDQEQRHICPNYHYLYTGITCYYVASIASYEAAKRDKDESSLQLPNSTGLVKNKNHYFVILAAIRRDKRVPSKPEGGYECKNGSSLGLIKNAFAFVILEQRKTNFITGRSSYYPVLAGKRRSPVGKSKIQGGKGPSYAMGPGARKSEQGVMSNRCTIIGRTRLFFVPRQRSWLPTGPVRKYKHRSSPLAQRRIIIRNKVSPRCVEQDMTVGNISTATFVAE
ncbi:hypothetical protein HZH66_005362 [Vespula vulgaris]|uniref:Uncharacterized protein n=1 Tax=Vespula vulgaris TaxID=7454 RepID=A0A834NAR6_VESVU|nr:hypothetical protein HZH66_005362 [Vespula vulgaris]